jgi:hypothetical protein
VSIPVVKPINEEPPTICGILESVRHWQIIEVFLFIIYTKLIVVIPL